MTDLDPSIEARHEKAHQRYRLSGLGLTTTVIGLCSGGIFALGKQSPGWHLLLLFAPIALALLQQMEQYRGGLSEAQAETMRAAIEHKHIGEIADKNAIGALLRSWMDTQKKANVHYGRADKLCIATVLTFIVIGFLYLAFVATSTNKPLQRTPGTTWRR